MKATGERERPRGLRRLDTLKSSGKPSYLFMFTTLSDKSSNTSPKLIIWKKREKPAKD